MRFSILGPLLAQADNGALVPLARPSQRSTLAVLLLHAAHPPTRAALIDALWGDEPPADADTALRVRVSDLRRALHGCDQLVTHQAGYRIVVLPGELDSATFGELASQGRAALDSGRAGDAASLLSHASGLWRDPPLVDLPDTPAMRLARAALLAQRRDVQEWLIDARLALGQHHELLAPIRSCIAADPMAEHSHVQLMLALYRCGEKAGALAAYTRLRDLTVREFGQDPGPEARSLLSQILADSTELLTSVAKPYRRLAALVVPAVECSGQVGSKRSGRRAARRAVRLCHAPGGRPARPAVSGGSSVPGGTQPT